MTTFLGIALLFVGLWAYIATGCWFIYRRDLREEELKVRKWRQAYLDLLCGNTSRPARRKGSKR